MSYFSLKNKELDNPTVFVVYINTMRATLDFNLDFTKLSNNMDTHKHGNKREASLCLLINFYFEKYSSNLIEKSSLFY